jgi:glutaryl-CoA dehydrogenase
MATTTAQAPLELYGIDALIDEDDRAMRDTVRAVMDDTVRPHIAQWYESGTVPARELAKELGSLGLLGMHLQGYGCAGTSATAYGLACVELEAADSGIRSLVSVQGSLAMFAIWKHGSEEQKQEWLPRMATGDAIGCFGLTEPDFGSDPAGMRTRARRDGSDWALDGTKMWITNGSIADVAIVWAQTDDGIRGFVVPTDTPGFSAPKITSKMSLRASVTSELVLSGVRLPETAMLPNVRGLAGPLSCLNEARFGILFGALGAARDCLTTTIAYTQDRQIFDKPLAAKPGDPAQAGRHDRGTGQRHAPRIAPRQAQGRAPAAPGAGQPRQAQQRARVDRHRASVPNPAGRQRHHPRVPGHAARKQPRVGAHVRGHVRGAPDDHRPGRDRPQRLPRVSAVVHAKSRRCSSATGGDQQRYASKGLPREQ